MRRPGAALAALVAVLIELAAVAALGNQWVYDRLIQNHDTPNVLIQQIRSSVVAFTWRATPPKGESRIWAGELIAILVLVVLTFFVVWLIVHTQHLPSSFFGVLVSVWGAVVLIAVIAAVVRGFIVFNQLIQPADRAALGGVTGYSVFVSPSGPLVLMGAAMGLVVGIGAAATASLRAMAVADREAEKEDSLFSNTDPSGVVPSPAQYPVGTAAGVGYPAPSAYPSSAYAADQPTVANQSAVNQGVAPDSATTQLPAAAAGAYSAQSYSEPSYPALARYSTPESGPTRGGDTDPGRDQPPSAAPSAAAGAAVADSAAADSAAADSAAAEAPAAPAPSPPAAPPAPTAPEAARHQGFAASGRYASGSQTQSSARDRQVVDPSEEFDAPLVGPNEQTTVHPTQALPDVDPNAEPPDPSAPSGT
jgi:hypothetical protein